MEIPIEMRVDVKQGLSVIVRLFSSTSRDCDQLKLASSLLADVVIAVEHWQSANGSYGVPMPKRGLTAEQRAAVSV